METTELSVIKAKYVATKFESDKGFCIYLYEDAETGKPVTCKGYYLPKYKNLAYVMKGNWKKTEQYGKNFDVTEYTELIENNKESITTYLASGIIKGIGKVTADRIYDTYGNDSIKVLSDTPEKLLKIKGITSKKLKVIVDSYKSNYVIRKLVEELLPFGINTKMAINIYNEFGISTLEELLEEPYKICTIHGVTVEMVDMIAKKYGYPMDTKERLAAHATSVLIENELQGNTGMYASDFGLKLIRSLKTACYNKENMQSHTIALIKAGVVCYKNMPVNGKTNTIIFRPVLYRTEAVIADEIYHIAEVKPDVRKDFGSRLLSISKNTGFTPDVDQYEAACAAIENSFLVLIGGPGTGKTTMIKLIASYLSEYEKRPIYFMAPTGRASRRMKESTGYSATTIYKGCGVRPGEEVKEEDMQYFEDCTLIIDEFSMVDVYQAHMLFERVRPGCRVIIVGDENQLQSVGPGAVLRDIIKSGAVPIVKLNKIHRQSEGSMIYINGQNVKNGICDLKEGKDFKMIQSVSSKEAQDKMVESFVKHADEEGIENVYCLCPCKENYAGVKNMNNILQEKVNPIAFNDRVYKANGYRIHTGDPVMHLTNGDEISNGDIGYVQHVGIDENFNPVMEVLYFGDTTYKYTKDDADDVTLAYAFTVHKAQGSENKTVITYLSKTLGQRMLTRNLINTSITRGKQMVELFLTNDNAIETAIKNDDSGNRITSLKYHLQYVSGQFVRVS